MRKIFSIIFILILLSPTAVWLIRLDFGINVERIGLKPPRFDARVLLNNDYYRSFDQYLNDSFSLRSPLVFAKRWLNYRLFGMTDTAAVHVGNQGWLFSRPSIEDYRKEACDDSPVIEQLILELHAIERMIAASGRQFIFTVAPNKSTIYPEFLGFVPSGKSCHLSHYDLLLEVLERYPLKGFVRLEKRLQNAKRSHALLYDPTSRYWNARGARLAAEAILTQIIEDPDQNQVFDNPQKDPISQGDLARRMLGLRTEIENLTIRQLTSSGPPDRSDAVVYGDGYLKNLTPYLSQMFSRLEVIEAESVPSRQHSEDWQAADIILLERAESELAMLRLDVDKILANFEAEVLIPSRYPIDLRAFVPQANISLNNQAEILKIKSVGNSSRLALMSIPGSESQVFRVLKLTVKAPHSDIMTIKFETEPPLVTRKALRSGITALYLPLPFQTTVSLSVNPGSKAGVLMLQSAEILTFAELRETTEPRQLKNVLAKWLSDRKIALAKLDSEAVATAADPTPKLSGSKVALQDSGETSQPDAPVNALKAAFDEVFANQEIQYKKNVPGTSMAKSVPTAPKSKIEKSKNAVDKEMQLEKDDPASTIAQTSATGSERKIENSKDGAANQKDQNQVSSIVATPMPALPAITLTDFADGRIFQRQGNSADIVISGTYSGPIEAIVARVVRSDTQEEIVPWTVIDPSPGNGIFVGQLSQVPQGGWYNIQVRSHSDHTVSDNGKHRWGVGMLIACLGQSNMKEWFYTGDDLRAHSLLRKFSDRGWSGLGTTGNAAIAFGNRIIERLGIPVGLLDYAVNGSGLRKEADWGTGYWADTAPDSIYTRFVSGVSAAGGAVEFVVWIQGEADAARGTVTENEYAVSLAHFIENQVRIDLANGSEREQLPFLVVMMIKRPGGIDKPHQDIRNAQKQVVENVVDCYLAAATLDLKNHGRQHLKPKAYTSMGNRVAQTALYVLGKEQYHRGPQVVHNRQLDDRTVEIKIQHTGGNDFKPASGISGWEIIANGERVPIQEVYRHDAQTIRIVTAHPIAEQASIRYLYGAMPDVNHPVLDNSPLSLPLEEYQSEIN